MVPDACERIDTDYGKYRYLPSNRVVFPAPGRVRDWKELNQMKNKSEAVRWLCLTVLVAAGMRYVPPYLLEQRRLDMQERALDLREEAFLHQQVTPTVSVPAPAHAADSSQVL